jgi:hypothetical protein
MVDPPDDLHSDLPPRISADAAALAPMTLSVTRRIPIYADPAGVMWVDHADLARRCRTNVGAICTALEQLARRGHVSVVRANDRRVGYRFAGAPVPANARVVVPFPRRANHAYIEDMAAAMARMPRATARLYLRRMLWVYALQLRRRGITEELIEREIDTLAAAIRGASFGAILTPNDQEPT